MFNTLDEQMERDERASTSPRERWLKYGTVAITSLILFGALGAVIWLME